MKRTFSSVRIAWCCALCIFLSMTFSETSRLSAQIKATVLFSGEVVSEKNGSPVNASYEITDGAGKKIKGKSADGKFQQVLKPGEHYTIVLAAPSFYKEPDTINLHASDTYYEENRIFGLRPIKTDDEIAAFSLFDAGSYTLLPAGETHLRRILSSLMLNKTLSIALTVYDDAVQPKKGKKQAAPPKKKKAGKGTVPPAPDLVQQRSASVQSLVDTFPVSIQSRTSIRQQKSKNKNNLIVSVAKISPE